MMELEKLRQAQAELTAKVIEEQTKITVEHAKTARIQSDILSRMERHEVKSSQETGKFNKWFVGLAMVALILALGQIIVPDGLPFISYRPANRINVTLDIATASPAAVAELTPTPSLESTPDRALSPPIEAP